ncbi:HlyD family type I secretion periplasmic adaptor subunit [Flaviflagellibacter deserti]|uniref:Membrane fusion protein (MFP) family protein n=1 Tax=Flaviflagellibacter deserti TaxID=2267266 RepID=A0ABV9Z6T2_9HYPH
MTLLSIVALIVFFLIWASIAEVEEIARGEGKVIPISKTQVIQASEPGVVQDIAVRVGQIVKRGDLIVRLDDTATTSTLGELEAKARALRAQIARLELEEKGDIDSALVCPGTADPARDAVCANEVRLLSARRDNFKNKVSVLRERLLQRQTELDEARSNIARLEANIKVSEQENALLQPLVARKLAAQTDLLRIQKELTDSTGQLNLSKESIKRLKAAVNEADLQVTEISLQIQQEALAEKTKALSELSVIDETTRGATDRVNRTDLRSPVDGVVNTLDVNTIGSYVQQGAVVAGVVPTSEVLLVEARISPRDVAFVRVGQPALVKVSAYDFSIYGGIRGEVSNVSADSIFDEKSEETYYQVQVKTGSEIVHNGKVHAIFPGMIASVDIMTGEKTVLQYLLKPVNKARAEALRER